MTISSIQSTHIFLHESDHKPAIAIKR
uniref:Uncharacterized protein n=1 Tax=Arundo donax TaxID=35708 RepID=A0A0A8Y7P3_ARUDO